MPSNLFNSTAVRCRALSSSMARRTTSRSSALSSWRAGIAAAGGERHAIQRVLPQRPALAAGHVDFRPARAVAQRVPRHVIGDGEQPSDESRARHVVFTILINPLEHLLGQFFRHLPASDKVLQHADQADLIADQQFLKSRRTGRSAAVADFKHEPHVRIQGIASSRRFADGHNPTCYWRLARRTTVGQGEYLLLV